MRFIHHIAERFHTAPLSAGVGGGGVIYMQNELLTVMD